MVFKPLGLAAALLLALPARAETPAEVVPPAATLELAERLCRAVPDSAECRLAEQQLVEQVVRALLSLAATGRYSEASVALVSHYAAWPEPQVREAAALALGGLHPTVKETALLARLLNDPVLAVRRAARAALGASSDRQARRLVERARWWNDTSYEPEPSPVEVLGLALALPEGAEALRFTRDDEEGIQAFVVAGPRGAVLDFFAAATGRAPLGLDELADLISAAWPGLDPNDPEQIARFYEELQERIDGLSPEEQQQAFIEAMEQLGAAMESPAAALGRWRNGQLWGDPRAFVLSEDGGKPVLLALVYDDRSLRQTGFALQWLPRGTYPGPVGEVRPPPASAAAPAAERPGMTLDEVEALLWGMLATSTLPEELEAFLQVFPNGRYRHEATARLEDLRNGTPPAEETAATETPVVETPVVETPELPKAEEPPPLDASNGPVLALAQPGYQAHQAIVVRFAGLPTGSGDWLAIAKAGDPDSAYLGYAMTGGKAEGEAKLTGQLAGDYEIRAFAEQPSRNVVARLAVTIAPAAPVELTSGKAGYAPDEAIVVRFAGMPGNANDWIAVATPDQPVGSYVDWSYTGGKTAGEVTLRGRPAGQYEIRAITDSPQRSLLARIPITVE